jgi:hypothetical protein
MNVNYPNLKAEMARKGDTLNTLSELLELSTGQISKRMNNQIEWSISEIKILCERYNKTFEELFK